LNGLVAQNVWTSAEELSLFLPYLTESTKEKILSELKRRVKVLES